MVKEKGRGMVENKEGVEVVVEGNVKVTKWKRSRSKSSGKKRRKKSPSGPTSDKLTVSHRLNLEMMNQACVVSRLPFC